MSLITISLLGEALFLRGWKGAAFFCDVTGTEAMNVRAKQSHY